VTTRGYKKTIQTATAMAVFSVDKRLGPKEIEDRIALSRAIKVIGQIQTVTIGDEILAVAKVSNTARSSNRSMIRAALARFFTADELVYVTTTDVEKHLG